MWQAVEHERRTLADLLDGLDRGQWERASLCREWSVREVAAHLLMTPAAAPGVGTLAVALVRARGHLWHAGRDVVAAYAAERSPAQIVEQLRALASSRRRPVFVDPRNILLDLLVHGQDIAVPLGLHRAVPAAAGAAALHRIWRMGWPFHARRRLAGVTLVADDAGWRAGSGPTVTGSAAALLLLTTDRREAALPLLSGPGLAVLAGDTTSDGPVRQAPPGQDVRHAPGRARLRS